MNRIKHLLYFYNDCPNWARTSDLLINNQAFYQLNYGTINVGGLSFSPPTTPDKSIHKLHS